MNKKQLQLITQAVGAITITLLAIYGLLAVVGVATPTVSADQRSAPTTTVAVPPYFNYEGTLREADGSLKNGTVNITAIVYDSAVSTTKLYEEDFSNVNVRDGQFNIVLGENPTGSYDLATAFETAPLFMGININNTGEIVPRERLHGVPWSLHSQNSFNSFDGVPVGGIINWWRPVNDDNLFPVPDGFMVCNGATVSDPESPLNGYALPDFNDRFAYSVSNLASIGAAGNSSVNLNLAGQHSHLAFLYNNSEKAVKSHDSTGAQIIVQTWGDGTDTSGSGQFFLGADQGQDHAWYTNNQGSHSHEGTTVPKYLAVAKLCRIR